MRISTPAGDAQNQLTVPGRFDDTDVVHLLADNLVIAGKSGEPILELDRPPVNVVTATPRTGGQMEAGTYYYKIVFVDANGFEGRPSEAIASVALSGTYQVGPAGQAAGRHRRFRRAAHLSQRRSGVAGPYVFVAQINTSDAVYTDTKSLAAAGPEQYAPARRADGPGVTLTASTAGGTLPAGTYNYRITYVNSATPAGESVVRSDGHARAERRRPDPAEQPDAAQPGHTTRFGSIAAATTGRAPIVWSAKSRAPTPLSSTRAKLLERGSGAGDVRRRACADGRAAGDRSGHRRQAGRCADRDHASAHS